MSLAVSPFMVMRRTLTLSGQGASNEPVTRWSVKVDARLVFTDFIGY